jgi:hypothetical protein
MSQEPNIEVKAEITLSLVEPKFDVALDFGGNI